MNKRKRTVLAHDNPIIAALRRSFPGGFHILLDEDRLHERELNRMIASFRPFNDASREIGALVVKALLKGDRQIEGIVKDALKEANHFFHRDREPVLRKEVAKYLLELIGSGLDIVAIKREIEKRSNCGNKLHPHQWSRLRNAFSLNNLPTGRPRKSGTKR